MPNTNTRTHTLQTPRTHTHHQRSLAARLLHGSVDTWPQLAPLNARLTTEVPSPNTTSQASRRSYQILIDALREEKLVLGYSDDTGDCGHDCVEQQLRARLTGRNASRRACATYYEAESTQEEYQMVSSSSNGEYPSDRAAYCRQVLLSFNYEEQKRKSNEQLNRPNDPSKAFWFGPMEKNALSKSLNVTFHIVQEVSGKVVVNVEGTGGIHVWMVLVGGHFIPL